MTSPASTIIQLATPRAPAAIHIIRISGASALFFLKEHVLLKKIKPRYAYYSPFFKKLPCAGHATPPLDHPLLFFFKAPHSFTGEDMAEIHCHGSLQIVDAFLELALSEGLRLANPGEFSKRAFLNGKLTLAQAEAVDALIRSSGNYLRNNALALLEKRISFRFSHFKTKTLQLLARLEASIEFPEEDIDSDSDSSVLGTYKQQTLLLMDDLSHYLSRLQTNYEIGIREEQGIKVALLGLPNAGKSTLLNLLLGEERALVSGEAGTTRDYLSEKIHFSGFPLSFSFFDTAGIREAKDSLEKRGIEKTFQIAKEADLLLVLISQPGAVLSFKKHCLAEGIEDKPTFFFLNKKDYFSKHKAAREQILKEMKKHGFIFSAELSLKEERDESRAIIVDIMKVWAKDFFPTFDIFEKRELEKKLSFMNRRQLQIALEVQKVLEGMREKLEGGEGEEVIVEDFRLLAQHLDTFGLSFHNEAVFDAIFESFCLGK